jgi:hypothetical protein
MAATKDNTRSPLEQAIVDFISNISTFLHHIPFCVSFIIFMSVSKAFRQEIKRMVNKMCCKNLIPVHEEENRQQHDPKDIAKLNAVSTIVLPAQLSNKKTNFSLSNSFATCSYCFSGEYLVKQLMACT